MKAPRRVLVNVPVPNIMFCCKQAYKLPKNVLKESKSPPSGGGGGQVLLIRGEWACATDLLTVMGSHFQ